jgi:hypothetical protein
VSRRPPNDRIGKSSHWVIEDLVIDKTIAKHPIAQSQIIFMATHTPPPYFPQSALSPSDPNKYRKFKLIIAAVIAGIVLVLAGIGVGIYFLVKAFA